MERLLHCSFRHVAMIRQGSIDPQDASASAPPPTAFQQDPSCPGAPTQHRFPGGRPARRPSPSPGWRGRNRCSRSGSTSASASCTHTLWNKLEVSHQSFSLGVALDKGSRLRGIGVDTAYEKEMLISFGDGRSGLRHILTYLSPRWGYPLLRPWQQPSFRD